VTNRPIIGAALVLCAGFLAGQVRATLELTPCTLTGTQGYGAVEAQCGVLQRPENPDAPEGKQIELFVARITSVSPEPQPDAFTIINGGPGASSVSLYVDIAGAFAGILRERDIVLIDQRGTGRSNALDCDELEEASEAYVEDRVRAATRACLASLSADPRYYATSQAVGDLDAMRNALGYAALNVYGVSYGTRVGLHYLRRYPDRVRTLVIDGVVPPDVAMGPNVAENAQAALNEIFERCRNDTQCHRSFPDLRQTFEALRDHLRNQRVALTVANPVTGAPESMELGYDHLALTLRLLSYNPETAALIPLIIAETSHGNYTPVAAQAFKSVDQLSGAISFGMHNSVVCSEDLPFVNLSETEWQTLEQTYLGADQLRALKTICEVWPAAPVDANLRVPLQSAAPVLVLSGANDPSTPPRYGERVSATLSNALHIIGAGQGHGIISRGCIPGLVTEFVEAGKWNDLDTSCAERLTDTPFFLDLLGPSP